MHSLIQDHRVHYREFPLFPMLQQTRYNLQNKPFQTKFPPASLQDFHLNVSVFRPQLHGRPPQHPRNLPLSLCVYHRIARIGSGKEVRRARGSLSNRLRHRRRSRGGGRRRRRPPPREQDWRRDARR